MKHIHPNITSVVVTVCYCQLGPDSDVSFTRTGPNTVTVEAAGGVKVAGELHTKTLKIDGVSLDQYVLKLLEQIQKQDQ